MGTVTHIGTPALEHGPRHTPLLQWPVIWVRTVLRSWRSGIHDLYSHIP